MKEQLESLANEMIKEVKDLKDLTKETLPEVAKEYITYNMVVQKGLCIMWTLISLVSLYFLIRGFQLEGWTRASPDYATWFWAFGLLGFFGGALGACITLVGFLDYKLQPRLKAIEGVVKLFKGRT